MDPGSREKYHTLDGLRGVAAILVVGRHAGPLGYTTPESFLAVDLFFCLSGFVIAKAYDARLAGGGFAARFGVIRLIRLYPLYLLGLLLGIAASLLLGAPVLGSAVVAGLLMIPLNPWINGAVGTFNAPVWTLPLELFANLIYALFHRHLSLTLLAGAAAASAVGVIACAFAWGNLDLGWSPSHLPLALSRLFFSFFVGIIIARTVGDRRKHRPLAAWGCIAAAEALLLFAPSAQMRLGYELAVILIGFPALIFVACQCQPSRGGMAFFAAAGTLSYAVYVLHAPLARIAIGASAALGTEWPQGRFGMLLFLGAVLLVSALADRLYDRGTRAWLTARLNRPRSKPPLQMRSSSPRSVI